MEKETFEGKIKPILLWMGTIVASIMAIAYVVVVFVLIEGFKAETLLNTTLFSLVTALVGFCIMQMLKVQGQSFAANIDENKKISDEYYKRKTKDKKAHSMNYYWWTSGLKDILVKCLTLAISSIGMVYLMIEGNGDYNLLFLAGVNLLMFAGFGLISLTKTYDFYNNSYVPYMLEKIQEAKEFEEAKIKTNLVMVEEKPNQSGDDLVHDCGRSDILDTSVDTILTSIDNTESLVLHNSGNDDTILGRTIDTSSTTSNCIDTGNKETSPNNKNEKEEY